MPHAVIESPRGGLYYGWKVVAALFIILTFCSGLGFYNHAVILQALINERGLSVGIASSAVSVFFLSSGVSGMWIAGLLERYDAKLVITAGALAASSALLAIRFVSNEGQLLAAYALFGVGFAASGLISSTTLITRWFAARRAFAMSIASTGLSIGGIVLTPSSALLIQAQGINVSVTVFALAYLVGVVPLALMFIKSRPADVGLQIDGAALEQSPTANTADTLFSDAIRDKFFWGVTLSFMFLMMAQVGALAHQYGIVRAHLSGEEAVFALSIIPATSIIGRLIGGALLDKFSTTRFTLVMMLVQSTALFSLSQVTHAWAFLLGLGLLGFSVGNLLMLQPLLLAKTYGTQNYSRIFGLSNMLSTVGIACGPLLLGLLYINYGSYDPAYLTISAAGIIGFGIFSVSLRRS